MSASSPRPRVRLVRAGIDTYQQPVVFMHRDCEVCRAEGFAALTRVSLSLGDRSVIATLNVVLDPHLEPHVAALSEAAWEALAPGPEELAEISHAEPPVSAGALRAKVFGNRLSEGDFRALMEDTVARRLSDIEIAAFVTACVGDRLDPSETIALTRAMVGVGQRLHWNGRPVLDKHCVGGLPGNRTTPIVVAVLASLGHCIPKTSSRAITSPAGTADTMEVLAPVCLDLAAMRRVVERENGCIVWGGAARLSPADDILIRVERPLDFDSDGQLVASVLSKKIAAGATHVLIDMPVGATAKVRSSAGAEALAARFMATGAALGLTLSVRRSDGSQPVGFGIGPALEASDVLAVLRREPHAPADLRTRALDLAAALIDLAVPGGGGQHAARDALDSGRAWAKFLAICDAQGGFTLPPVAIHRAEVRSRRAGVVGSIDNRRLARTAKLAGAPIDKVAGLLCRRRLGDEIGKGDVLFEVHASTSGQLQYALDYVDGGEPAIVVEDPR